MRSRQEEEKKFFNYGFSPLGVVCAKNLYNVQSVFTPFSAFFAGIFLGEQTFCLGTADNRETAAVA